MNDQFHIGDDDNRKNYQKSVVPSSSSLFTKMIRIMFEPIFRWAIIFNTIPSPSADGKTDQKEMHHVI